MGEVLDRAFTEQRLLDAWTRVHDAALSDGTFTPHPVMRAEIPEPGGGQRKLAVPCVADHIGLGVRDALACLTGLGTRVRPGSRDAILTTASSTFRAARCCAGSATWFPALRRSIWCGLDSAAGPSRISAAGWNPRPAGIPGRLRAPHAHPVHARTIRPPRLLPRGARAASEGTGGSPAGSWAPLPSGMVETITVLLPADWRSRCDTYSRTT
jgi:hypothetical protein